jgi:hypothetical protein
LCSRRRRASTLMRTVSSRAMRSCWLGMWVGVTQ